MWYIVLEIKTHFESILKKTKVEESPVKFGIKLWVLADTITGYTSIFFVYLGKKRTEITDISKGLSYAVVFNLLPEFFNQGYLFK
jgi:hypothetical protein